jgi:hypothetical protein
MTFSRAKCVGFGGELQVHGEEQSVRQQMGKSESKNK